MVRTNLRQIAKAPSNRLLQKFFKKWWGHCEALVRNWEGLGREKVREFPDISPRPHQIVYFTDCSKHGGAIVGPEKGNQKELVRTW